MTYPSAPWNLKGYAVQSLQLIDIKLASNFVPPELKIISFLPGKTLGGIYISHYQPGSLLEYNELIIVPAFVRYKEKIAAWISHIYVDNENSVTGGREIWGLPKEMAKFNWGDNSVSVIQPNYELCQINYKKGFFSFQTWWKQSFKAGVFSGLNSELLFFENSFNSQFKLISADIKIPHKSPFSALNLTQPLFMLYLHNLEIIANTPSIVEEKIIN